MSDIKKKKYPATCVVHWPTGPVNCCEEHAQGLVALSHHLGSHLAVTKLTEKAECSNCISENNKE